MNRIIGFAAILLLLLTVAVNVYGATANNINPKKGNVGQNANIHGSGLSAGPVDVKFGNQAPVPAPNPRNSDTQVKIPVPAQAPGDPPIVQVRVFVNGIETEYPSGILYFQYTGGR